MESAGYGRVWELEWSDGSPDFCALVQATANRVIYRGPRME
jgi:hypothetical protein